MLTWSQLGHSSEGGGSMNMDNVLLRPHCTQVLTVPTSVSDTRALPATVAFAKDKPNFKQYKRIHQNALNLIRTGKAVAAVEFLALVEAKLPRDAETQYMLAVAQCTLGQVDAAEASVAKALKLGLPVGRIIGGSHNGLDAIHKRPLIQRLLEQHGKTPVHGPMIGNLSGNSRGNNSRRASNSSHSSGGGNGRSGCC